MPALAAFFPYVAVHVFDSPLLHGVYSADVFFLLLSLALPQGEILWKMPLAVAAVSYAFFADTIDAYAVVGVYLLMIFVTSLIPRQKRFLLPTYVAFALSFFIADCGNFFYSTFVLTLSDVWGLAKFYWWGPVLFLVVPLLQISLELLFARKTLWGHNRLQIPHVVVFLILIVSLVLNFGVNKLQQRQSIMDFALQKCFWQLCTPGIIGHNSFLQENTKAAFPVWQEGQFVIENFSTPTVMILVESFGVNKSVPFMDSLFASFVNTKTEFNGLFLRSSAHTQGAEWEDFLVPGGIMSGVPLPQRFKNDGLQTYYLHGYDKDFYNRGLDYAKFGFDSLLFRENLENKGLTNCHYGFTGVCDSSLIGFMDSLLADSIPKFIYWTTLDAHPPYELANIAEKTSKCLSLSLSNVGCTYFTLQENTLLRIASLAKKYPNYRFVIRGDHRPMGSFEQSDFVQSFYFKWVPLIILN